MPTRPCPACDHDSPRYLEGASQGAYVRYYRCDACGLVFNVSKSKPHAPPTVVAPGKGDRGGSSGAS
jgi:hypothetical protein